MKKIFYLSVIALTMFSCGQKASNGADEQAQADSIARADSIAKADSLAQAKAEADSIARVDSIAKADSIAKVEKAKAQAAKNSAKIEQMLKVYAEGTDELEGWAENYPTSSTTMRLMEGVDNYKASLKKLEQDMTPEQKARFKKISQKADNINY